MSISNQKVSTKSLYDMSISNQKVYTKSLYLIENSFCCSRLLFLTVTDLFPLNSKIIEML